jgi:hypothetical protein
LERSLTLSISNLVRAAALGLVAALLSALPVEAARPLLDKGQWDAYFALFARDVNVPWKAATVRLDTYSGAPVDFSVYGVDPADVIIAGQNRQARPLDTSHRKAIARWKFFPPAGFRFNSNDVGVPLGTQEGFYVVEARRGDAVQQVWMNRTHIGLLSKESPEGLLIWAVDLRTGRPLSNLRVSFLVNVQLIERKTDANGLVVWRDLKNRPIFALAERDSAIAFVSILPQAPLPSSIVGIRLESAVARAGSAIHFAGFARRRVGAALKLGSGDVRVTLGESGRTLAAATVRLDAAGAFDGTLEVPENLAAGDYAVLASGAGGVGGTTLHVDAVADVALAIRSGCPCDPKKSVALTLAATRAGVPVPGVPIAVVVVRSPHTIAPGGANAQRWGTTVVYDATVQSGADGRAQIAIAPPTDGLDSTYGIQASATGATATAQVVVANAPIALDLEPAAPTADPGAPVAFDVHGFDPTDGAPAAGAGVHIHLSHGSTVQDQDVTLDAQGRARAIFRDVSLGSNLALADAAVGGRHALDAAAVTVEPSALSGTTAADASEVSITLDKPRYRVGDKITVRADAKGASGDALITLDGARTYATRVGVTANGEAVATLDLGDPQGDVRVSAAFVRDGAIAIATVGVTIDGPGHLRATELALDRPTYDAGATAHVTVRDGGQTGAATYAIRVADGRESGSALFDDAPAVLASGGTTSQNPASENPTWHAYVEPASSKASDIFAAEQPRKAPTDAPSIGAAAPRTMLWLMQRSSGGGFDVEVPKDPGRYVLSLLKISENGSVGAASIAFEVR